MSAQEDDDVAAAAKAWETAMWGSDLEWFTESGNCGGCGVQSCHPGKPCGDVRNVIGLSVCNLCPNRAQEVSK